MAAPETQTNTESQDSAATSPTFIEKNISTLENNNENLNPETEITNTSNTAIGSVCCEHSPKTSVTESISIERYLCSYLTRYLEKNRGGRHG